MRTLVCGLDCPLNIAMICVALLRNTASAIGLPFQLEWSLVFCVRLSDYTIKRSVFTIIKTITSSSIFLKIVCYYSLSVDPDLRSKKWDSLGSKGMQTQTNGIRIYVCVCVSHWDTPVMEIVYTSDVYCWMTITKMEYFLPINWGKRYT